MESMLANLWTALLDVLKWAWGAIILLLLYIFRRHSVSLSVAKTDIGVLQRTVVYRTDLDSKAEEIKAEVKEEHQRIINEQRDDNRKMRDELVTCNQNVMSHIAGLATDVREMRTMMMSIIDRRHGK